MIRWVLVVSAVGLVGLIGLPPLLRPETSGEAWTVATLLMLSLAIGLFIIIAPETLNGTQVLISVLEPVGSFLFGPR